MFVEPISRIHFPIRTLDRQKAHEWALSADSIKLVKLSEYHFQSQLAYLEVGASFNCIPWAQNWIVFTYIGHVAF